MHDKGFFNFVFAVENFRFNGHSSHVVNTAVGIYGHEFKFLQLHDNFFGKGIIENFIIFIFVSHFAQDIAQAAELSCHDISDFINSFGGSFGRKITFIELIDGICHFLCTTADFFEFFIEIGRLYFTVFAEFFIDTVEIVKG